MQLQFSMSQNTLTAPRETCMANDSYKRSIYSDDYGWSFEIIALEPSLTAMVGSAQFRRYGIGSR